MRVEQSISKRATCCICGDLIEDDYRVFDCGAIECYNRDTLYYHIDCIIKAAKKLDCCTNLAELVKNSWRRGIDVSTL